MSQVITFGDLLQEAIANEDIVPFENGLGITKRPINGAIDIANLIVGSNIRVISKQDDMPPLLNGARTLEQAKNYFINENVVFSDEVLVPAGYAGDIQSVLFRTVSYTGVGSFLSTLNIDGIIDSVATADGGSAITVATAVPHGLLDGQFINMTTLTLYNQRRLAIFNVGTSTFDVQITFVGDDTGEFNTGYESVALTNFNMTNSGTANFMDLTSIGDVTSTLLIERFSEIGFLTPGIVRKGFGMIFNKCGFGFITDGLILEGTDGATISDTSFLSLDPSSTTARGLIIQGGATRNIIVTNSKFIKNHSKAFPNYSRC